LYSIKKYTNDSNFEVARLPNVVLTLLFQKANNADSLDIIAILIDFNMVLIYFIAIFLDILSRFDTDFPIQTVGYFFHGATCLFCL